MPFTIKPQIPLTAKAPSSAFLKANYPMVYRLMTYLEGRFAVSGRAMSTAMHGCVSDVVEIYPLKNDNPEDSINLALAYFDREIPREDAARELCKHIGAPNGFHDDLIWRVLAKNGVIVEKESAFIAAGFKADIKLKDIHFIRTHDRIQIHSKIGPIITIYLAAYDIKELYHANCDIGSLSAVWTEDGVFIPPTTQRTIETGVNTFSTDRLTKDYGVKFVQEASEHGLVLPEMEASDFTGLVIRHFAFTICLTNIHDNVGVFGWGESRQKVDDRTAFEANIDAVMVDGKFVHEYYDPDCLTTILEKPPNITLGSLRPSLIRTLQLSLSNGFVPIHVEKFGIRSALGMILIERNLTTQDYWRLIEIASDHIENSFNRIKDRDWKNLDIKTDHTYLKVRHVGS